MGRQKLPFTAQKSQIRPPFSPGFSFGFWERNGFSRRIKDEPIAAPSLHLRCCLGHYWSFPRKQRSATVMLRCGRKSSATVHRLGSEVPDGPLSSVTLAFALLLTQIGTKKTPPPLKRICFTWQARLHPRRGPVRMLTLRQWISPVLFFFSPSRGPDEGIFVLPCIVGPLHPPESFPRGV